MSNTVSSVADIRSSLGKSLEGLGAFSECSVLDYPDYFNIGDHLIWLGTLQWLLEGAQAKILYAASGNSFASAIFEKKAPRGPIFLSGGGNLGDLWPSHQEFREKIISRYPDRRIIVLPQSIHFKNEMNLERAKRIFNAHPDLTIFTRSQASLDVARRHFSNCRSILAPDMAFLIEDLSPLYQLVRTPKRRLYLCRHDQEMNPLFTMSRLALQDFVVEDWNTMGQATALLERLGRRLPFLWRMPVTRCSCNKRLSKTDYFKSWQERLNDAYDPLLHQRSLLFVLAGLCQLSNHEFVMTNRLHGHILCLLLGMPHILLPDLYEKNKAFYETWTSAIPTVKFGTNADEVKNAIRELAHSQALI